MTRQTIRQRIASMSLCGRLSGMFVALALAGAVAASVVTGTTHGLKLAAGILFFGSIVAGLELFFPPTGPAATSSEAN